MIIIDKIKELLFKECILFETGYTMFKNLSDYQFGLLEMPQINCFNSDELKTFISINANMNNRNDNEYILISNELKKIIYSNTIDNIKFPLSMLDSIQASKSKSGGYKYKSIYEFGKETYSNLRNKSKWSFGNCIDHITRIHPKLDLIYYAWNDRFTWDNTDGSHHYAVATYLAEEESRYYEFEAKINIKMINPEYANSLIKSYDLFIMNKNNLKDVMMLFSEIGCIYFTIDYTNNILIALKKNSRKIPYTYLIKILKNYDKNRILYLNNFLQSRLSDQKKNLERLSQKPYFPENIPHRS